MIAQLTNHLWQSTLFVVVAGLLSIAFRKNRAQVRYWLWFSASLKFFVPFSLLMSLGSRLEPAAKQVATPAVTFVIEQITEPFPDSVPFVPSTPGATDWKPAAVLAVWACGFAAIALIRFRGWLRIRAAVCASSPIDIPIPVEIRSSPGLLEPGVVGLLRPILLLPAGIAERLTPPQLEAVLAHELCHVRRRDNLFASIHMIVEATFWFHPLVWWIGAKLVEERERACDEEVLSLGSEPRVYAEGIVNVCKLYMESPLACVSGVTGSNLKKRIEAIMTNRIALRLNFAKKVALAVAGMAALALPIVVGIIKAPAIRAQSAAAATPKFEVASIKPCTDEDGVDGRGGRGGIGSSPGRLGLNCRPVMALIHTAYVIHADGHYNPFSSVPIEGGPAWIDSESDLYQIDAKAEGTPGRDMLRGPMLQGLLEDRFKLKIHRETRMVPVYELTVAKGGHKLKVAQEGNCVAFDRDNPPPPVPGQPPPRMCGGFHGEFIYGTTMAKLCWLLSGEFDRPVIDETGLAGVFDMHLDYSSYNPAGQHALPAGSPIPEPGSPAELVYKAAFSTTIQNALRKLGLNVKSAKGPGEFLVIDHIEKPSGN